MNRKEKNQKTALIRKSFSIDDRLAQLKSIGEAVRDPKTKSADIKGYMETVRTIGRSTQLTKMYVSPAYITTTYRGGVWGNVAAQLTQR